MILNLLETIWLLAGVAEGIPPQPQRVWLQSIPDAGGRTQHPPQLPCSGHRRRRPWLRPQRRSAPACERFFRHARYTGVFSGQGPLRRGDGSGESVKSWTPVSQRKPDAERMGEQFVILSTQSATLPSPPAEVVRMMVRLLRASGRTVLHNVRTPLDAATGTLPLLCTYKEFLCPARAGIPFVGWRNGLCDIAAASSPPCASFTHRHSNFAEIPSRPMASNPCASREPFRNTNARMFKTLFRPTSPHS